MSGRPPLALTLALVVVAAGSAIAVAPLEGPRTSFQALELPPPGAKAGVERRWWGLSVRTSGDDVPFPEREPAVLIAARDVDPETQLVRSVAIVVRNAGASGWLGGPGASAKVETLREDALAAATKLLDDPMADAQLRSDSEETLTDAIAGVGPVALADGKRRVVAVLALGSAWPALDRALAFSVTESLVKAKAADVVDLESAERFLLDVGMDPAAEKGPDPPLASWALALGVDAVAAVRATSVRAVASADDGADVLSAEVLWSRSDGGIDRSTTTFRVPHRTYPARGKLRFVMTQAESLSAEMIPKLPPAGSGRTLFASREVTAVPSGNGVSDGSGVDPGDRSLSSGNRNLAGASASPGATGNEDPGMTALAYRGDSGAERDVLVADPFRRGAAETESGPSVNGERGPAGARKVGETGTAASGASIETLALSGLGSDGSVGGSRTLNGAGGAGGAAMETLSIGEGGTRDGTGSRNADGASGNGTAGMEPLSLDGPGSRGSPDGRGTNGAGSSGASGTETLALVGPGPKPAEVKGVDIDWCALQPKARALGADAWLVHHPLNQTQIIRDADPMLVEIAKRLAGDRGARVRVIGHTCNVGEDSYNFTLGSKRADETREKLVELGVPPARIDSTSTGEQNPVCTNANRTGRMNNRRTEIRIDAGSDHTEER